MGKTKKLPLKLSGEDGNAYVIMGRAKRVLERAGRGDEWPAYEAEATSGDYDRLLLVTMKWFDVR